MWNLFRARIARLFIHTNLHRALARGQRHRRNFSGKSTAGLGRHRALQRSQRIGVLCLAGELEVLSAIFGECAHKPTLIIGIFETIQKHAVLNLPMTQPRAAAHFRQEVWRLRHAFHATYNYDLIAAHS